MLFMQLTNRDTLSVDDITEAMYQHNMEPLFGYTSADASLYKFARVADNHDIFYVEDGIVDLSKITQEVITAAPEPTIALHWLAINGIQPATPQNPTPVERAAMLSLPNTIAINLPSTTSLTAASTVSRREMHTKENTLADIAQRRPGQMLLFQADAVHSLTYEQYRCLESIIHFTRSGRLPETLPTIRMLLTQSGLCPTGAVFVQVRAQTSDFLPARAAVPPRSAGAHCRAGLLAVPAGGGPLAPARSCGADVSCCG